jgi:hypothetical protein
MVSAMIHGAELGASAELGTVNHGADLRPHLRHVASHANPDLQPRRAMAYDAETYYLGVVGHGAELRIQSWGFVFDAQGYKCEILTEKWLN